MTENADEFMKKNYYLKTQPFAVGYARYNLEFWTNREKELEEWKTAIQKVIKSGQNRFQFIVGDYGMGKTISLMKIQGDFEKSTKVISVLFNLKTENKRIGSIDFIFKIFENFDYKKLVRRTTTSRVKEALDSIPSDGNFREPKSVLFSIFLNQTLTQKGSDEEFEEISDIGEGPALDFLRGLKISAKQKRQIGVKREIDSLDVAKHYLASLLIFMRFLGYPALIILVDEFEYLFQMVRKPDQAKYFALFRSLYDLPDEVNIPPNSMASLVMFMTVSQEGFNYLQTLEERSRVEGPTPLSAMNRRTSEPTLLLGFDKKNVETLIELRLKFNRVDQKFEKNPLIPFDQSFVNFVHLLSKGAPNMIIKICDHVLDEGIKQKVKLLNEEFAKLAIEKSLSINVPKKD